MRIVVNGQQAFGADVLKALLERGEEVVAVYCAPDKEGRPPDPLGEAAREAGIELHQPESFDTDEAPRRAGRPRARPHGHGVRDPHGPRAGPERPDAWHDPVPPVAPAAPPRAERDQLGDHPGRRHDRRLDLLARRRPRHRPAPPDQGGRDHPGRHARQPVLRQALSDRGRRADRGRRPRPRRQGAQARAERRRRHLRELVRPRPGRGRLVQAGPRGPRPDPRANPRPGAWTTVEGDEIQVLDADRLDDDPGAAPGEVVAVDGDRLVVAAGGGAIAVRLVRADGDKLEAGEYARNAGLTAGVRLGV